jgi:lipopolysaccharide export system protein LptA
MKNLTFLMLFLASSLISQELKVRANQFSADEKSGISIFDGKVNVVKGKDEINAHKVKIYTDKKHQPTKFIATGDVSFRISTKKGSIYKGKAQKVVYKPKLKEYNFFGNVHLQQLDEKKEIIGDEVVLKTIEGKAYAKGAKQEPVIMIFNINEEE